jgi:hypothetical protein
MQEGNANNEEGGGRGAMPPTLETYDDFKQAFDDMMEEIRQLPFQERLKEFDKKYAEIVGQLKRTIREKADKWRESRDDILRFDLYDLISLAKQQHKGYVESHHNTFLKQDEEKKNASNIDNAVIRFGLSGNEKVV